MKEILVELKGKEWTDLLDHVYEHKKADIKIDGFRKGQVPKDVYIKKFGVESLYMDAVDHALPELYNKMVKENKDLEIVCRPSADIKEIDNDHVKVMFTLVDRPEVKLGEYKNLGIKKDKVTVSSEEIDHELDHIKSQFVDLQEKTTGEVEDGNVTIIDFEGFKDGKPFEGGKGEDYELTIGSNSFIPGFEEGMIGMKLNEEKDLNLKFPKDYHVDDLKGKEVVFKVKVKAIKEKIYPEFDEEFFKDLNMPGVDSVDKLKEEIKNHIESHKEMDAEDKYFDECLTKASENATIDVPKEMISEEIDRITHDFSEKLQMQGMNLDTYMKVLNIDSDKLREQFEPEALKRVRFRLIIEEVVKLENIKVMDKELNDYSKEMAEKYQVSEEEFLKEIGGKDFLEYDLKVKKALEIITGEKK